MWCAAVNSMFMYTVKMSQNINLNYWMKWCIWMSKCVEAQLKCSNGSCQNTFDFTFSWHCAVNFPQWWLYSLLVFEERWAHSIATIWRSCWWNIWFVSHRSSSRIQRKRSGQDHSKVVLTCYWKCWTETGMTREL